MRSLNHFMTDKPFHLNEEYKPTEEDLAYRKMMATARPKFIAPIPSKTQSDHVNRVMSMTDAELEEYRSRPIDYDKAQVKDENGNVFVNERQLNIHEFTREENRRRSAKNQLGESKKSIASDEQKESARQAFVCTPPAPLTEVQVEQLTKMDKIKQLDTMPPEIQESWFQKLLNKFKKEEKTRRRMIDLFSEEDKKEWEKFTKGDDK